MPHLDRDIIPHSELATTVAILNSGKDTAVRIGVGVSQIFLSASNVSSAVVCGTFTCSSDAAW